ncbi:MMPL family transporter [Streptomyces sp. NPDC087263]|uniref:MMPL family transporter n=1 Tax=Streptomyces sp. NPDC087263 TaxID=3365773 RepID=UPI003813FB36
MGAGRAAGFDHMTVRHQVGGLPARPSAPSRRSCPLDRDPNILPLRQDPVRQRALCSCRRYLGIRSRLRRTCRAIDRVGLSVVGIPVLSRMGRATVFTVFVAVQVALTLLPALLGFFQRSELPRSVRNGDGRGRRRGQRTEGDDSQTAARLGMPGDESKSLRPPSAVPMVRCGSHLLCRRPGGEHGAGRASHQGCRSIRASRQAAKEGEAAVAGPRQPPRMPTRTRRQKSPTQRLWSLPPSHRRTPWRRRGRSAIR